MLNSSKKICVKNCVQNFSDPALAREEEDLVECDLGQLLLHLDFGHLFALAQFAAHLVENALRLRFPTRDRRPHEGAHQKFRLLRPEVAGNLNAAFIG